MGGLAVENKGPFTMVSGEALVSDRFVLISASTAKYADGGEEPIGLTQEDVLISAPVAIAPLNSGKMRVTGSKAITAGSNIYVTTDGKVSDAAVGKQIGILITAITGDGGKGDAIVWGPRGGNDIFASSIKTIYTFEDDFFTYDPTATVGNWAVVEDAGAGGGDVITDAAGGVLSIGCDGDDNDECYVSSIAESWIFTTNKKVYFECRISLTEANVDDANWCIGLSDVAAANTLVDDGASIVASYDGAFFYKLDAGVVLRFNTSNAAAQTDTANAGAFTSGAWYVLGFLYDYNDGVTAVVTPYVNGVAGTAHNLTIAGLQEMHIVMGVKAGDANEEALLVDYVRVQAER